jgi:hypothetical protein
LANPGTGFRTANSLLAEISLHLLEPLVNTQLTGNIGVGVQIAPVTSTVAMYVGALLVVDLGGVSQEIVSITAINPGVSFTANFVFSHLSGAVIITPTFPTQQPTDPFFTQTEMLTYLARAQNDFLVRVPSIFQRFQQVVSLGIIYQTTPASCIEIDRIAVSNPNVAISTLTRTAFVVTAVTLTPHNLSVGSKFNIIGTATNPVSDATFPGTFVVTQVVNTTTFKYSQNFANGSANGGYVGLWSRLYEVSQEELTMSDRNWQIENQPVPTRWFEDRAANYRWGIGSLPVSNFPVELLCSIRDSDTLVLTDGFLVPDPLLHYIKYRTLEYAWSKDGVQANPSMAHYCHQRFEMGVLATQRWLDGVLVEANRRAAVGARR